nr:H348 [uncultured bacterium]
MKDQYFGDVNDYLKNGLLRCLREAGWRIGVCWMLTPDDDTRSDGGKVRYLSQPRLWRRHDPALFDALSATVGSGSPRNVAIAEEGGWIQGARFFSEVIPDSKPGRTDWFARALAALSSSDLIFFDPDNGLEVPSKPLGSKDSSKYLFWDEARLAWEQGASLLIFQHFARENRDAHIGRLADGLSQMTAGAGVMRFRSSNVLFLLACQSGHQARSESAHALISARWMDRIGIRDGTDSTAMVPLDRSGREAVSSPPAPDAAASQVPEVGLDGRPIRRPDDGAITNAMELTAADLVHQKVICPACEAFVFRMWPEGWDAHAAFRCSGLETLTPTERKREFRRRFGSLFRSR